MRSYTEAEKTVDDQENIINMISKLRESLISGHKQLLNKLLDCINDSDINFTYATFSKGFLLGMKFMADYAVA